MLQSYIMHKAVILVIQRISKCVNDVFRQMQKNTGHLEIQQVAN